MQTLREATDAPSLSSRHWLAAIDGELASWRQRQRLADASLQTLTQSRAWRLLEALRSLRRLVASRNLEVGGLLPSSHLEPMPGAPEGTWLARAANAHFLIPCLIPAGWVRIRLHLTSSVPGLLTLSVDNGNGFDSSPYREQIPVSGDVHQDFFMLFPTPVRAVRLEPLGTAGEFRLHELRIEAVPRPLALAHALRAKWRQLRGPRRTIQALTKGMGLLARGQFGRIKDSLRTALASSAPFEERDPYERWQHQHRLTELDRLRLRTAAAEMEAPPLLSVLLPVYNVAENYLRRAIESVRRQTYDHWELCLVDDASTEPHVRPLLDDYARRDSRIRVAFRERNGNIAAASNTALALARGEYVALLDHDDELAEHALSRVAEAIVADRSVDMLYSDEDKLTPEGRRIDPFFKPDWSPEYFLACMYTCHLGVYRTALIRELGGFRSDCDGAQDYDLVLRLTERTQRIQHIPEVLYHWRLLPSSTASGVSAKPYAQAAARRALEDHLERTGRGGHVEPGPAPGFHRVRFDLVGRPKVSIIVASACRPVKLRGENTFYIAKCVESIRRRSTYDNYEILLLSNHDIPASLAQTLERWQVRTLLNKEPFNWSRTMNLGVSQAMGDYLLFLNDDMEVITPDWLECLLEFAQQPQIGAVGARLLFPDDTLQHAGVTILDGNPGHAFYRFPVEQVGYFFSSHVHRNYSAVTGACLMTRAEVFRAVGGFDEFFPLNYNDIDFCLKVVRAGQRIVYTPHARLYHHESATKPGCFLWELERFHQRWRRFWPRDPYYNPNLSQRFADFRLDVDDDGGTPS